MSRIRNVKGKITEIIGGDYNMYSEENIVFTSALSITETGEENGVTYGEPQDPPLSSGIKEIEIITALDDGSANDLSGGLQKGFIYGNTYEIKVKSYINHPPQNKDWIKWMIKYHDLSQNSWVEIRLTAKGDYITLTINNNELCGRFVYVRAYLRYPEREAELKVWMHNRFRWFDRSKIDDQIKKRVKDPWKIDQGGSSLCGMAALYYVMIKRDSQAYEKLAKELFRTGEYAIGSYVIEPHEKALSMYETKPTDSDYKSMRMQEIDWIVLATSRSKESLSSQFVYNGFENNNMDMFNAVNWPEMLTRMCKEVAGFTNAEAHGLSFNSINNKKRIISARIHDYFSNSDLEELLEIDRLYKLGKTILLMIDSDMISNKSNYNSLVSIGKKSHWIVYEGGLQLFDDTASLTSNLDKVKFIKFKIYTWGYDPITQHNEANNKANPTNSLIYNMQSISIKSFKSNYYGYIEAY